MATGILLKYGQKGQKKGYCGLYLEESFFKNYLSGRVTSKVYDEKGTQELLEDLDSLTKTSFEKDALVNILKNQETPKSWRVGEAIAECYLEDYNDSNLPYPQSRDAKNPKSNLTGADLVGFVKIGEEVIFLFGEVKTSDDPSCPPNVLYGRCGMTKQLEDLKEKPEKRAALIRWLGFKVKNLAPEDSTKKKYLDATKHYLSNKNKVKLVGVLVRDCPPEEKDLQSRYKKLIENLDSEMNLELVALYTPTKINDLVKNLGDKK